MCIRDSRYDLNNPRDLSTVYTEDEIKAMNDVETVEALNCLLYTSFGMPVIKSIRKESKLFFDVHLMVTEPERYIRDFVECLSLIHI